MEFYFFFEFSVLANRNILSQSLTQNTEVCFFYSIALCIESHSIYEWPLSKNFCSMMLNSVTCTKLRNKLATCMFLFCPPQVSENRDKCLTCGGKRFVIYHNRQLPISQLPRFPLISVHAKQKPLLVGHLRRLLDCTYLIFSYNTITTLLKMVSAERSVSRMSQSLRWDPLKPSKSFSTKMSFLRCRCVTYSIFISALSTSFSTPYLLHRVHWSFFGLKNE